MLFYVKFHLLKAFFIGIGKNKSITDFLAGVHGLGNVLIAYFSKGHKS